MTFLVPTCSSSLSTCHSRCQSLLQHSTCFCRPCPRRPPIILSTRISIVHLSFTLFSMRSEVQYAKAASKWDIAKLIYREIITEKQWQLKKKINSPGHLARKEYIFPFFPRFCFSSKGKGLLCSMQIILLMLSIRRAIKASDLWCLLSKIIFNSFKRKETNCWRSEVITAKYVICQCCY